MSPAKRFGTEQEFTAWLTKKTGGKRGGLRLGIGDDAALIEPRTGYQLVATGDMSVEGVHFAREFHPPEAVGHRALARSLSDIAAMGGRPRFALLSLAIPAEPSRRWIELFLTGTLRLARRYGVTLVGGDTAVGSSNIIADVAVLGELQHGRALLRSGARPGDQIFVGGSLGLSALGLRLLRSGKSRKTPEAQRAIRTHLYPEPQCELGMFLARRRIASAAIDVSDGLSTDLNRLATASKAGARVWADRIPRPRAPIAEKARLLPLALHGGEDYKLLFTVPPARVRLVPRQFEGSPIYAIGEVQAHDRGIEIVRNGKAVPLKPEGYDHFRSARTGGS